MKKNIIVVLVLLAVFFTAVIIVRCRNSISGQISTSLQGPQQEKTKSQDIPGFNPEKIQLYLFGSGFFISEDCVAVARHIIEKAVKVRVGDKHEQRVILYLYNNRNPDNSKSKIRGFSNKKGILIAKVLGKENQPSPDIAFLKIIGYVSHDTLYNDALKPLKEYFAKLEGDPLEKVEPTNDKNVIKERVVALDKIKKELSGISNGKELENYVDNIHNNTEKYYINIGFAKFEGHYLGREEGTFSEMKDRPSVNPLPISLKNHATGKIVCIPGQAFVNSISDKTSFFMYTARIAGGEFVTSASGNNDRFDVYFDKPVHLGMSGSPVINSNMEVVALQNGRIGEKYIIGGKGKNGSIEYTIPFYSHGLSGQSIKDEFDKIPAEDKNGNELHIAEPSNRELNKFPEFEDDDLDKLRSSIVWVRVYK